MNDRAYLVFLFSLLTILSTKTSNGPLPTTTQTTFTADATSFPWPGTFLGINAQPTPPQVVSGPFQASSIPQSLEPPTNNPFYVAPSSLSAQTTESTAQSIVQLLGNSTTPFEQKVNATFGANTTIDGTPMKITPGTKYRTAPAVTAVQNLSLVSYTQLQKQIQTSQQPLFPNNPQLAAAYQNFMGSMEATPSFLPLFRKLHLIALHEIYIYLTGIYTSLNMTHIDDLKTYMLTEKKYALNKKTLIINHLINVIMAQLNQALRALMPGLPESYAIHAGMMCIKSDQLSDPNFFIVDLEKSVLAVLGLEKISSTKLVAAYNALASYSNLNRSSGKPELFTIAPDSDLQLAREQLNNSSFSVKLLSKNQAAALVNALDTIITYLVNQQSLGNLQVVLDNLLGSTSASAPTTQQVGQFAKFITQCVYGGPLDQEIAAAKTFATLLGSNTEPASTRPLTTKELALLRGILGYILQRYEAIAAQETTKLVQVLGEFNPTYQVLSPSQALALKTIAEQMLPSPSAPPALPLQNLTDTQRASLAYGLWVTSSTATSFSQPQIQTLQSLAISLKQGPMSNEGLSSSPNALKNFETNALSSDQQTVLQKALTLLASYELSPLTSADFDQAIRKNVSSLSPTQKDQDADIVHALKVLKSPTFHSFDQLTSEEQIILLKLFQNVNQVFETRLQNHLQESTELAFLLAGDTTAQNNLFSSISSGQYEALNAIDAFLATAQTPSFYDISQVTPMLPSTNPQNKQSWMDPKTALLRLFTLPTLRTTQLPAVQPAGTPTTTLYSYLSILVQLQTEHFQNKPLLSILPTLTSATIAAYKQALPLITSPNFEFSQLSTSLKQSLAKTVKNYMQAIEQNKTTLSKGRARLNDPQESALETVANVVRFTDLYTRQKQQFLWTLKQYLLLFNLYAQTLQNVSNDTNQPYTGLTEFAGYAQTIQQALNYQSGTKEEMTQLIAQTNPPLFFYNAPVFRGIRLLPKLALLVENSSVAPYPTFGIEQASSPTETAIDPLTSQPVTNLNTEGSFQYQKFFFLQAPDANTELTGSLPAWINKVPVPSSTTTPAYLYEPNSIPQDGITGFYMNIPTFEQDPTNAQAALLRLYQQPIIAQPLWLNKSGTGAGVPTAGIIPASSAGVVTVLRGCLGDFQALLNLGIFDPCLTIIFKTALSLEDATKPITTPLFSSTETQACAAYLVEKQAALSNNPLQQSSTVTSPTPEGATIMLPGASQ